MRLTLVAARGPLQAAAALCVSALVLASCGGNDATDEPGPNAVVSNTDVADEIIDRFDVGGGRRLYLECHGSGTPTILFEAGGADDSSTWPDALLEPLQRRTRTCAYDRAGTGASAAAPNRPRTMADLGADLDALLAAAGVTDDLLLVGSSFGGQVALDWALHHSERTAGLVLLDADWPTADLSRSPFRELTKQQRQEFLGEDDWDSPSNVEHIAFMRSLRETEGAVHELLGIPILVLTASQLTDCPFPAEECARIIDASIELQKQWLQLSPTATRRVVESGHVMHQDVPDTVVEEVVKALDAIG